MTVARCTEPDCVRLVWRDGLCWWCWQARRRPDEPGEEVIDA